MPVGYEYHLDHRVIVATAWDVVSLTELGTYHRRAGSLPGDLRGAVEYLDLSEVVSIRICDIGAMQLAAAYEGMIGLGIRGSVVYAPDDEIHEVAGMIIATCAGMGGGLPDGYRLTRTPVARGDLHHFLDHGPAACRALVA